MYQDYFWDFDGTLYDTYAGMVKAFCQAFSKQKVTLDPKEIYYLMRVESVRYCFSKYLKLYPQVKEKQVKQDYRQIESELREDAKPFEGASAVLKKIAFLKGRNFLLTHRNRSALQLLEKEDLTPYFTAFVTADDAFKRKPAPDSLNFLIEKYHVDRSKAVMVGDRTLDIEACHNAKISGILFDPDCLIAADACQPERVVRRLSEIIDEADD